MCRDSGERNKMRLELTYVTTTFQGMIRGSPDPFPIFEGGVRRYATPDYYMYIVLRVDEVRPVSLECGCSRF